MSRLVDSSEEESEEERMAFTEQNDFEDGQWIDGEFYARNQKRGRHMSKKEAIYGVFADLSSEEDEGASRRKGRKRGKPGGLGMAAAKPLSFIRGGVQRSAEEEMTAVPPEPTQEPEKANEQEESEGKVGGTNVEEDESRAEFQRLMKEGTGGGFAAKGKSNQDFKSFLQMNDDGSSATDRSADRRTEAKQPPPARPVPEHVKRNMGSWQKHTKGFGMKMLEKFGFKGRLGKDEAGIAQPVEVKVRPSTMGLGYGGFKEATELKANRELEREVRGTVDEEEDKRQKEQEAKKKAEEDRRWKKSALPKKPKRVYKTAAELVNDSATAAPKPYILDMRGPQTKMIDTPGLGTVEELSEEGIESEQGLGQELVHNVRLIVDLTEVQIFTLDRKIQGLKQDLSNLRLQQQGLQQKVEMERGGGENVHQVLQIISKVRAKMTSSPDEVSPGAVIDLIKRLKAHYPAEYRSFHLIDLMPEIAHPVMRNSMKAWKPLEEVQSMAQLLLRWEAVLTDGIDEERAREDLDFEGVEAFQSLMRDIVLPKVRSAIQNDWNVKQPEVCVSLLKALQSFFSPTEGEKEDSGPFQTLLVRVIYPKLAVEVERWDPRTDPVHIHTWIHPWIPLLKKNLEPLYPNIRFTLSSVLKEWHPSDSSAHTVVSPWKDVWDPQSMETFLVRSVIPKLVILLREFVVDPTDENHDPLRWVLQWSDVLPSIHMVSLLEGEFFPKWLPVLHAWLADEPDYAEVWAWYASWKAVFPSGLAAHEKIKLQFNKALKMMNDAVSGALDRSNPPTATSSISYSYVLEKYQREVAVMREQAKAEAKARLETEAQAVPPRTVRHPVRQDVSFKEVVEKFAEEHNVTFVPNTKKQGLHLGNKPLYLFGPINVYIDQDVIFAEDEKDKKRFSAISLDHLLARAQTKR